MALVITMLFCTCVVAHGLTLEDYSGEWKATHVIMDGTEIAAWLAGLDMILEIDGTTAYLTSKAMELDHAEQTFIYNDGLLKANIDNLEFQIVHNSDDTLKMNLDMGESGVFSFKLKRITEIADSKSGSGKDSVAGPKFEGKKPAAAYDELKRGDKSDDVKAMQERLIELNWLTGSADGDFGPKTEAAVKDFQSANNLRVTGVADGKTQKVLFTDSAKKKKVYQKLNYKAVSRDPDQHSGEFYGFSGKVIQVLEDGNKVQLRVATKDGYDDVVFVTYTRADGESRILEDDRVNVYGIYRGLISYESIFGEKITLPQFEAEQVRVK